MVKKGSKTEHNLMASFAGESQARSRYMMYASVAKKEGFVQIANIFTETAAQEFEHAKRFFRLLPGDPVEITACYPSVIGDTAANLRAAAAGENEEHTKLYPEAAEIAEKEGFKEAAKQWQEVAKVEQWHEARYLKLLKNVEEGVVFKRGDKVYWKCINCGRIVEAKNAPLRCPACDHPQAHFELLAEAY
ncbi:MAG: rubrerythrin family protein [Candidatus Glassbacteria bacterium]|nr:rubrerythrin family protein [Candidatus Glassbacteria bacterium]